MKTLRVFSIYLVKLALTASAKLRIEIMFVAEDLMIKSKRCQLFNINTKHPRSPFYLWWTDNDILVTAKWMACVYRSLDEFSDNQSIYDKLKAMKIIPLANYQRQSTNNSTIFFPLSENTGFSYNGKKKYAMCLHFVVKKIKCSSFPLWNKMQEWNTQSWFALVCICGYI